MDDWDDEDDDDDWEEDDDIVLPSGENVDGYEWYGWYSDEYTVIQQWNPDTYESTIHWYLDGVWYKEDLVELNATDVHQFLWDIVDGSWNEGSDEGENEGDNDSTGGRWEK